jgi:hypothetical protein
MSLFLIHVVQLGVESTDVGGVIGDVGDILTFPYIHAILVRAQKSSH